MTNSFARALGCALICVLAACAQPPAPVPVKPGPTEEAEAGGPTKIIFDTDLGYDCDDAGALAVLHALADRGEAEVLATVTVVGAPYSAGALSAINTYYGRPDLPIGAYGGERWSDARPYWFTPDTDFLEPLATEYPTRIRTKDEAEEAVSLYRKTLAAQPDGSVTIVTVGFFQNLVDLLRSEGDAYSPLTGRALVAKKVLKLVAMGGRHPENPDVQEFNFSDGPYRDGADAQTVVRDWPTPIVFSGSEIGDAVMTGSGLADTLPDNPVARAYELFPGTNERGERQSWDLTAVLYAVRGAGELWEVRKGETLTVFADGSHAWRPGAADPARAYLEEEADPAVVKRILDDLLTRPPSAQGG